MHNKTYRLFVGLAMLAAASAYAEEEIIVTGARTALATDHLGSATTIITREDIDRRQARYVTDLLRAVPGFAISQSGAAGSQTQVRVRGAEANHVLVLIDGVRANDPATGDEFRWEYLTTGNVERIEVVRGPQSALWGSDAIAAVVHVITRGSRDNSGLDAFVEGGSFATNNIGVGGSLVGDGWSLNAGLESLETEGSNISRSGDERDGSDITTASLGASMSPDDAWTFDLSVRASDAYSQFDPVDYFVTGLPTDGDVATESDNLYTQVSARYDSQDSRVAHTLRAGYIDTDNRNFVDGTEDSSSSSDRTALSYQADIALGENLLALALEHETSNFEQRGAVVFGDPNQNQDMHITSIVADYQLLSFERVTWLISARFDDNSDFDNATSGRLSVAWDLSDSTILRGNIGTGSKNPTFTDLFGFFPGQFVGNPNLKPERSTSVDIGIDKVLRDGALVLQASLFKQDLEDEINGFVFDPVTFLSTAENESTTSKRSGVELGARWRLSDQFDIATSYTYTDSEQDGTQEVRRPRHSAALALNYVAAGGRFAAALAADYDGTRTDVFFPPFPEPAETVSLASYWLVDLTLQYRLSPSTSVYLKGANLLDEDYEQVYGYQTPGRAGYLGLRLNFGD